MLVGLWTGTLPVMVAAMVSKCGISENPLNPERFIVGTAALANWYPYLPDAVGIRTLRNTVFLGSSTGCLET